MKTNNTIAAFHIVGTDNGALKQGKEFFRKKNKKDWISVQFFLLEIDRKELIFYLALLVASFFL